MKIFSLSVILAPPSGPGITLSQVSDLSSYTFYQKGTVGEFKTFFSKKVAERTPQGQRQSVQENNYAAHVYNRGGAEQLAGPTDFEYPVRPAFSLLTKLLDDFTAKKYQDPANADNLMRVQHELDEAKIVLHKTIDSVLRRGENLEALSATSKMFHKTAKKQNGCCSVM
ncbi:snare protein YKT6 [Artomyces pyxidatus]|uniref:Snare protein YKT6 n=1 Tax=Artomyces pyxidatus TaxID=48021 RepID=A0ACB8SJM7_9AGAM|nr:snare protein YKT6 [Artomyces pyxidatus]